MSATNDLRTLDTIRKTVLAALAFGATDSVDRRALREILKLVTVTDGGKTARWSLDRRLQHARRMRAVVEMRRGMDGRR